MIIQRINVETGGGVVISGATHVDLAKKTLILSKLAHSLAIFFKRFSKAYHDVAVPEVNSGLSVEILSGEIYISLREE